MSNTRPGSPTRLEALDLKSGWHMPHVGSNPTLGTSEHRMVLCTCGSNRAAAEANSMLTRGCGEIGRHAGIDRLAPFSLKGPMLDGYLKTGVERRVGSNPTSLFITIKGY